MAMSPVMPLVDSRDNVYASLINADDQAYRERKHAEDQEKIKQDNMSPYAKLTYYDRMLKLRADRKREEDKMAEIEKDRVKYQRNVLRKKNLLNETQGGGGYTSKYQTPTKSQKKGTASVGGSSLKMSKIRQNSEAFSATQNSYMGDQHLDMGGNYIRKISKYDLDR